MKIERTKNATRNILAGVSLKIYNMLVPFVMRTIILYILGVNYLGLDGLFTSILAVLNLSELGIGVALVNSMYRPIAEDNKEKINALMRIFKIYYRIIGLVILVLGAGLTVFIPKLVGGDLPTELNIYILYWLNLGCTVLTYWLFGYRSSILSAHQRADVQSKVTMVTNTIRYVLQIVVLVVTKSYYLYLIVNLASQILHNLICAYCSKKMYPEYAPVGKLPKHEIKALNQKIRDIFTTKIGAVVVNQADTLVISTFLGVEVLAIYQNYYFILTAVTGIITIIFSSCTAGIGNSIVVESKEKNFGDLSVFVFFICWISGIGSCCFLALYQPFMELWVGKELMLDYSIVISFVIFFFVFEINSVLNTYKDAAGIWHEDRFRTLITALVNLVLNLAFVQKWGVYGVRASTVISTLFVGMPWLLHNLFSTLFEKKYLRTLVKKIAIYSVITCIVAVLTNCLCHMIQVSLVVTLISRLLICIIVPNVIYILVYRKTGEFRKCLSLVSKITNKRFDKILNHLV